MNNEELERVFEWQVGQSRDVLLKKQEEYAAETDCLHNFKVSAAFLGGTPKQALMGFLTKHLVSLSDMVRLEEDYPIEVWEEKLGDAMNYLILLRAILEEEETSK